MAALNVNREVTDQFYRYKMPKIIAKVEGKGNGIKTVIVNMLEVSKALGRPPTYPTKYFGCELGAQTQFDSKNDRFIVNGSHDATKLQDLLDGFIKRFVLCTECDNPETQLNVKPKVGVIGQRCIACGHGDMIDMRHKLTTFILKNPPTDESLAMTAAAGTPGKDKPVKGKKGKRGKDEPATNGNASPETGNGDVLLKRHSSHKEVEVEEDDVDWGEDVSDAAVQARRMEQLTGAISTMVVTDDLEKTPAERVNIFYNYVKVKKDADNVTGVENEKSIVGEAERLDIKDKACLILVEVLLNTSILTQAKTYRNLFLRFTHENPKAQKALMGGLEQLIGVEFKDNLLPKTAHILKLFYDLDIFEEEVLIEWGNKGPSKKYVKKEVSKEIHEKAKAFVDWLKEAEEEESSDDDDEEEVIEVAFSQTEKVGTQAVTKPKEEAKAEEEDDFNIDDI